LGILPIIEYKLRERERAIMNIFRIGRIGDFVKLGVLVGNHTKIVVGISQGD